MSMQYGFFVIPVRDIEDAQAELNRFLQTVRVVEVQREFVDQGWNSYWSVAVEYYKDGIGQTGEADPKKKKPVDYREVLSPEDFSLYAKLRDWRKETAAQESVPVYTLFTNQQLAKIVTKRITAKADMQKIAGIGEARVKKYGDGVIAIIKHENQGQEKRDETQG